MTRSQPNDASTRLDVLVELARKPRGEYLPSELDAGLRTVVDRLGADRARRSWQRRMAPLAVAALVTSAVLVLGARWLLTPAALGYEVRGGVVLDAGYLRANDGSGVMVTFEEGTQFALAPGARARLRTVDAQGARLGLEHGKASFDVVPDVNRRWEVEVGPFLVRVKGTSFKLAWDPEKEQFELDLEHGKVLVSGPISGGELTLNGGQRLSVQLAKGETRITEVRGLPEEASVTADSESRPDATSASSFATAPNRMAAPDSAALQDDAASNSPREQQSLAPPRSARGETTTERASGAVRSPERDWSNAMARGQWARIVRDAEQQGISTVLTTASVEELFTLANAARYRQRSALARDALLALRWRFPASARATEAAFLLGRVAEARGEFEQALTWYDEYLRSAPKSTYAGEALGRKMTMVSRSRGRAKARPVAEEYLRRHPQGSYAGAARALVNP